MSHLKPTRGDLENDEVKKFAFLMAAIIPVIFGFIIPLVRSHSLPLWPWIVGWCLSVGGGKFPTLIRPLQTLWMGIGKALGWFNSRVILGIIFFLIVTPFAFVMRWSKRDPLCRFFDKHAVSYRVQPPPPSSFLDPF